MTQPQTIKWLRCRFTPTNYDEFQQTALIVDFHGYYDTGGIQAEQSGFKSISDKYNFVSIITTLHAYLHAVLCSSSSHLFVLRAAVAVLACVIEQRLCIRNVFKVARWHQDISIRSVTHTCSCTYIRISYTYPSHLTKSRLLRGQMDLTILCEQTKMLTPGTPCKWCAGVLAVRELWYHSQWICSLVALVRAL